jgi:Spy/CpxP family protein refolding chaperone
MARQTAWVLALVLASASTLRASFPDSHQHGRAETPTQVPGKDAKDKPQTVSSPSKPPERDDRWKWWLYNRAELGITDKQSADINQVFESTIPKLREARQEQDKAEEMLSQTIKEHKADLAMISMLVDRAESARSQHNKMRTLMLYRIDLLLTADQRTKLEAFRAQRDAARRDKDPQSGRRFRP